jgi:hypothetical protein
MGDGHHKKTCLPYLNSVQKENKMKASIRIILALLFMSGLLFIASPSYAGDGGGTDEPREREEEGSVSSGLLAATQQLPGGGYAYAEVLLSWSPLSASGKAKTGLSSGVQGTFSLCSEVVEVYKNGVQQGGASLQCASKTAGQSITRTKTVTGSPYQKTWRVDTYHGVSAAGFSWWPSLSLTHYIP